MTRGLRPGDYVFTTYLFFISLRVILMRSIGTELYPSQSVALSFYNNDHYYFQKSTYVISKLFEVLCTNFEAVIIYRSNNNEYIILIKSY